MRHKGDITITMVDVYRCAILGLMGLFYGFVVFLMFQ